MARHGWLSTALVAGMALGPTTAARAEPQELGHRLVVSAGLGATVTAKKDHDGGGTGVYAGAEYAWRPGSFFSPRLYGGILLTFPDEESCGLETACDVQSKIGFAGGKLRLMAPIPYVGPFIELGLGVAVGYLRTLDVDVDERTSGVAVQIPIALGLALGDKHQFDVMFLFLGHPSEPQGSGALAVGLAFPMP